MENLYMDDSIETLVRKYCMYRNIQTERFPYIWTANGPLRFQILGEAPLVNPFEAKKVPNQEAMVQYKADAMLLISEFNLVTYEALAKGAKLSETLISYYFPNPKDTLGLTPTLTKSLMNEQRWLERLWKTPRERHTLMTHQSVCVFNRASYKGVVETPFSLKELFHKLHSSALFPLIQSVEDLNHIHYKLYKQHRIPETLFHTWTSDEYIRGDPQLVCYSFVKDTSLLYAKIRISIDETKPPLGNIFYYKLTIYYKLDFSENISYDQLQTHQDKILQEFKKYGLFTKVQLEIDYLSLRTTLSLKKEAQLTSISKWLASLLPIYTVPSKNRVNKNLLDVQFKRIAKYGQVKNIREYIQSKMALDIPILDIILDLQEYGLDESDVRDYIEEIRMEATQPKEHRKKDVRNLGLLLHLSKVSGGIQVHIDNASSFHDIYNALFWMRSAMIDWEDQTIQETKTIRPREPSPVSSRSSSEASIRPILPPRSKSASERSDSELSLGSDDEFFGGSGSIRFAKHLFDLKNSKAGGAVGKEYHRYFNTLLKQIDPNIFGLTKNYARKCGVSDLRQPVGISKDQKKFIDQSNYKDNYDNAIEYGSHPEHQNVYLCPRIWCPKSQVPLRENETCPLDDEKPLMLYDHSYWYNDPKVPHYVGFLKEKGHDNVKLPCCFKKLKQEKESQTKVEEDIKPKHKIEEEKDIFYIIDKPKLLPDARFGTIPQTLHDFLYPEVPYQLCRNSIKTQECLLRRGIPTTKDTWTYSIMYLMGFTEKNKWIQHIQKQLDPLTFLTLENGRVYASFAISTSVNNLSKEANAWFESSKTYTSLFDWDHRNKDSLFISRQESIYQSYRRFMDYLKDDSEKNPQFFYDLVKHLGWILLVWNRDNQTLATLKCPYAMKSKTWWMGTQTMIPFGLILQQEEGFEPLVIVDASKNIHQRISMRPYPMFERLTRQCHASSSEDSLIQSLYQLQLWVETVLLNPSPFYLTQIVLDYNYRIHAILTHGSIWIELPTPLSLSNLSYLQSRLPIDRILYWEDLQGKMMDISISVTDYRLFTQKIKQLNLGVHIGTLRESEKSFNHSIQSILTIPMVVYKEMPWVPLQSDTTYKQRLETIKYDDHEWYKVKKYILKRLIENPSLTINDFKHLNQPSRVATIMEELSHYDSKNFKVIYQELLLHKQSQPSDIQEGHYKKEWWFSQKSLEQHDLTPLLRPHETFRRDLLPMDKQETVEKNIKLPVLRTPAMMDPSKCHKQPFPTKWRLVKWAAYEVYLLKKYQQTSLYDVFQWMAYHQGMTFQPMELQVYTKKKVYELLTQRNAYPTLFEDPSMRLAWNASLKRNYRTMNELIEQGLGSLSIPEIQQRWIDVLENHSDKLWFHDLDLYNLSRLFRWNFFVLIKGKSADKKTDDILSSCKFISISPNWKHEPLLMLYREISEDKTHFVYGMIAHEKIVGYYRQTGECPSEWLDIFEKLQER